MDIPCISELFRILQVVFGIGQDGFMPNKHVQMGGFTRAHKTFIRTIWYTGFVEEN
jgi:hypothetical protein